MLSNQKDEIEKENVDDNDFVTENKFNREVNDEDENNFELSRIKNQNKNMRNKTMVTVSGHDQAEVRRKIKEILIKAEDYF